MHKREVHIKNKERVYEFFVLRKIRAFFEQKYWWKHGIYWLLKSSCFELFGYGKYGLFLSEKVDEKIIFTEKFLFWTFRWWEIRSFFQPRNWWKDDIYLVFFSFTWYSRAWEIWFFVQWHQYNHLAINCLDICFSYIFYIKNTAFSVYHFYWLQDDCIDMCLGTIH